MPQIAVLTPSTAGHFFERLAEELPSVLADGAVLWLGVNWDKVVYVRRMLGQAGWRIAGVNQPPPDILVISEMLVDDNAQQWPADEAPSISQKTSQLPNNISFIYHIRSKHPYYNDKLVMA